MYNTIKIENYRVFQNLEIAELGQVNLFVGRNNAGKTAILEAVELLTTDDMLPSALFESMKRRQEEYFSPEIDETLIEINHLFTGHYIDTNSQFQISGKYNNQHRYLEVRIVEETDLLGQVLAIKISGTGLQEPMVILFHDLNNIAGRRSFTRRAVVSSTNFPVRFLSTAGADDVLLRSLWDSIMATPEEEKVYEALYPILPTLERIVFTVSEQTRFSNRNTTAGVFVKLKGMNRVPLGSMGEGTSRLLGLAIYLVKSAGGYLLIDEIDTGLHYSVMEDLWRFIIQTAKQLNVQVFATTHNGDCVRALAWLQEEQPELAKESVLYRIEPNMKKAIRYSAEELEIAARHHIEVRG